MSFAAGQSDQEGSDIFDEDEVFNLPRPFPLNFGIPREIHYAPPKNGNN